tara:strand:- start:16310 stop:16489 length:180 start_codon:yes stop_codon:yes gene_type:complete
MTDNTMSKTWELEITTRHEVEAETRHEAIVKANNKNIIEFVRINVVSVEGGGDLDEEDL